ncbi:MAG: hypothetical protein IPO70_04845 [Bacteroidetes bacterium]|nr:hypothetical protein [Bacteroidota bacterium]MBK9671578.1 hypothetical protein [Bacteroidota bacterium]MBP6414610.1 hypothetical protein [Bacteroidia bacterium]
MRILAEIPHPACKITVFYMNQKYIVKFEKGNLEQSYKISELEYIISGVDDVKKLINESFINQIMQRFQQMQQDLQHVLKDV